MLEGQCLCGDIRFEIDGTVEAMSHCHCSMCRKLHGSLFATYAGVRTGNFRWTAGESRIAGYESSPGFLRAFCPHCGSVVPDQGDSEDHYWIPAGNLTGDPGKRPYAHIFVASKAPWYEIEDDLPRHDAYPEGDGDVVVRPSPPPPSAPGRVHGGCQCGAVEFEFEGPPLRMWNCHCSRCRRARGAAHATNVFVAPAKLEWIRGHDNIGEYRIAQAERFTQAFCRTCGSALPRTATDVAALAVPAGCLDQDPGIRPGGHIYVASKAPWFEIHGDLARYDEAPPG